MRVVFRADASHQIGTGHVTRCLTLANALRARGARCVFVCRALNGNLLELIRQENFFVYSLTNDADPLNSKENYLKHPAHAEWLGTSWYVDAMQTIAALADFRPDWIIVDHYALDARWHKELRAHCVKLMVIDDIADRVHDCDLLLDQNLVADMTHRYDGLVPAHCGRMLGAEYALLQSQYSQLRPNTLPRSGTIKRILVFFGGADIYNLTGRVIAAFLTLNLPGIALDVVINPISPYAKDIREQVSVHSGITLHGSLPSLALLMRTADLAIGAGGSTSWERCCLGLPSIVVTLAKNQIPIAAELNRKGYIRWIGHHDTVSETALRNTLQEVLEGELQSGWSQRCMELIDGLGTDRVAKVLTLNSETRLTARLARLDDEALILSWVNDPLVRQRSFNPNPIDPESHRKWFHKRLDNPENYKIYIVETEDGLPIGQVRFEKDDQYWEIHYLLTSLVRNRGIGRPMLKTAILKFKQSVPEGVLFGQVRVENISSQRVFKKLGFEEVSSDVGLTYRML